MGRFAADTTFLDNSSTVAASSDHIINQRRSTTSGSQGSQARAGLLCTSDPVTGAQLTTTASQSLASRPVTADTLLTGGTKTLTKTLAQPSATDRQLYIVFLDDAPGGGGLQQRTNALLQSLSRKIAPSLVFDQLNGFAVNLSSTEAQRLRAVGGIKSIEADAAVSLDPLAAGASSTTSANQNQTVSTQVLGKYSNTTFSTGEILPWGVQAVWQGKDISTKGNIFSDTYAFVIDSGVTTKTGDLNLASINSWHRSWISGEDPFTDGNGHGTHVSGTIAALANGNGVIGVAPGANIVSLKVFNSSGSGASYSSIIDAINHAVSITNNATNALNKSKVVINMSLGGSFSSSLDSAVKNAANQGIRFSIAAGNNGRDADGYSPAAAGDHVNVFTVSATDSANRMASFSNWDRLDRRDKVDDVDVAAPGVGVLSYNGSSGLLASWNGTSMAAPHVAGLLLTGGVTRGDLVTPFTSGTADPFAWGSSTVI